MLDRREDGEGGPGSISWLIKIWNILVLGSGGERNIKWQEDGDIFSNSICISAVPLRFLLKLLTSPSSTALSTFSHFPTCPCAEVSLHNHTQQQPLLISVLGGKKLPHFSLPVGAEEWLGPPLGAGSEPASSAVSSRDAPRGAQGWTSQASHPPVCSRGSGKVTSHSTSPAAPPAARSAETRARTPCPRDTPQCPAAPRGRSSVPRLTPLHRTDPPSLFSGDISPTEVVELMYSPSSFAEPSLLRVTCHPHRGSAPLPAVCAGRRRTGSSESRGAQWPGREPIPTARTSWRGPGCPRNTQQGNRDEAPL